MRNELDWFARLMLTLFLLAIGGFIGVLAERSFGPNISFPDTVLEGHAIWAPDEAGEPEFTWLPMCTEDHDEQED
jgi:hypothetical protein